MPKPGARIVTLVKVATSAVKMALSSAGESAGTARGAAAYVPFAWQQRVPADAAFRAAREGMTARHPGDTAWSHPAVCVGDRADFAARRPEFTAIIRSSTPPTTGRVTLKS